MKPIIEEIWNAGHQTLFYAEGDWTPHLGAFAQLPDASIVYHVDRADIFETHKAIGHKFCLSGGVSNYLLAYGTPDEVRQHCKEIIDGVAQDGGYILDASAIIQNAAQVANVQAMTEAAREYGAYDGVPFALEDAPAPKADEPGMAGRPEPRVKPGVCVPWEDKRAELPEITGDEALVQRVWEANDGWAHTYAWHCLLSF